MKQCTYIVKENTKIARNVYKMRLFGDTSAVGTPGQFVNILVDGCYLRRPFSVADRVGDVLTVVYRTVGQGTERMAEFTRGHALDVLVGLGQGFDLSAAGKRPLLVGGGVGAAPLLYLARRLSEDGRAVTVLLGFRSAEDVILTDDFHRLGASVHVVTEDGTGGTRGLVTDVLPSDYTFFYACGPLAMLRALDAVAVGTGEYSLEERMGCGFGACLGCTHKMAGGALARICKEGPVFRREALAW